MTNAIDMTKLQAAQAAPKTGSKLSEAELLKLKKTCADFESIFTYEMIKTMRRTIPETKMGMSNYGKETYTMMMDQKLAETLSSKGEGLGLQKALFDQLIQKYQQNIPKEGKKF